MEVYRLNPLDDPRWAGFVDRHPKASVFHTPSWLRALQRTYGYEPVAFTTSMPNAELTNGIVFCDVRSWLTGHRLVSLPFSDHCQPLVHDHDEVEAICAHVEERRRENGWQYVELRTREEAPPQHTFTEAAQFWFHVLDLRPDTGALLRSMHKDSIQRKIRRAEREGLTCEEGSREGMLRAFYRLLLLTRLRHQLPPQPFDWFDHLATSMGAAMTVRVARLGRQPVAAVLTLAHRNTVVYKYGASDAAFHALGGMPFLFWRTIECAHARGCETLDLGRSDLDNAGLATFKDRLGAHRRQGSYWRYPARQPVSTPLRRYAIAGAKQAFAHAPEGFRAAAGRLLYRHVG